MLKTGKFLMISIVWALCACLVGSIPPTHAASEVSPLREVSVSFSYHPLQVYGGRLTNSKAALVLLYKLFARFPSEPNLLKEPLSFVNDVIGGKFHQKDGFVWTDYGYAYGTCGAASLLNQLARTALFRGSDGRMRPLFLVLKYTRERNPTYGTFGAADYVWRLNPDYRGPVPRIAIRFHETKAGGGVVTMSMRYQGVFPG